MEKTSTRLPPVLVLLPLLFVDSLAAGGGGFRCRDLATETDPVTCLCSEGEPIEIQCPIDDSTMNLSVKNRNRQVNIQCLQQRAGNLDLALLPSRIDLPDTEFLKIEFCALNVSFGDLLRRLNVASLKELSFESITDDDDDENANSSRIAATKEMFDHSLRDLERLTLSYARVRFDEDFLENVPELTQLTMNYDLAGPLGHYFRNLTRLRALDLSNNEITALSDGAFRTLNQLRRLILFNNQIAKISDGTFVGLTNVTSLELSNNRIDALSENAFAHLRNLVNVSLRSNRIRSLHANTFSHSPSLQNVRLSHNPQIVLPDRLFANLTSLASLDLSNDLLETLPEHVFDGCSALEMIDLQNNSLSSLPAGLFDGLRRLKFLDMSKNKLSALPDNGFASLERLLELRLDQNRFTSINPYFLITPKLKILNLKRNNISFIHPNAFALLSSSLTDLDLSHNAWNNSYDISYSPLNSLENLENLWLHHNQLVSMPELYLTSLKKLDYSHNRIDFLTIRIFVRYMPWDVLIYLNNNKIREVDFFQAEFTARENKKNVEEPSGHWTIYLQNNPIDCSCGNYDLFRYYNREMPDVESFVRINQTDSVCANDGKTRISDVRPINVQCSVIDACPDPCNCSYTPYDKAINVNCSHRQLSGYPDVRLLSEMYERMSVDLRGNWLTDTPTADGGYSNVRTLDLSENRLGRVSWIPPSVQVLNFSSNALKTLEGEALVQLENDTVLVRLDLQDNPWDCTCGSFELQKFLTRHYHKVNTSTVVCANSRKPLVLVTLFCPSTSIIVGASFAILFLVLFPIVTMALYYRYRTEIKVYLYAKNLCMWFITEEELDKDKTYDVFISYAHQDEQFVVNHLLKELEHGDHPYKVCIHIRDWTPGEFIAKQVIDSVKDSRRTLVVLSNHFVDSVWGKLEFRTAHTEAISEGRARVIAVVYGDLDESRLDDEIRAYMKTNTYVQWGDKYFWQKLKYALPHSRHFYHNNKKRAQVMRKIDDKFDLITSPPSPAVTSTPPITLDPTLLENVKVEGESPLLFAKANGS